MFVSSEYTPRRKETNQERCRASAVEMIANVPAVVAADNPVQRIANVLAQAADARKNPEDVAASELCFESL